MFLLFGCQPSKDVESTQLNQPSNLQVEGGLLSWDVVPNASKYHVFIDEVGVYVDEPFLLFDEEGNYNVYVIAISESYIDSIPSEVFSFSIEYSENVIFVIEIDENNKLISWNSVNNASHYLIYINGSTYTSHTNQLAYHEFGPALLSIRIQAIYPVGQSNISEEVYVEHLLQDEITLLYQYSKHSTQNIKILNRSFTQIILFDSQLQRLDNNDVLMVNNEIEIKSDYVLSLEQDKVVFYLYSDNQKYKIQVTINNKTEPYLISSSMVYTEGNHDIMFQFELFGGIIKQISGNQLDEKDYLIEDNLLTITQNYIQNKFESDDQASFTYALEDEHIVMGFLMIYESNN